MTVKRAITSMDSLVDFATHYAAGLFGPQLAQPSTLARVKRGLQRSPPTTSNLTSALQAPTPAPNLSQERVRAEFTEMAPYFTAASAYVASKSELFTLSHVNLQVDDAQP